MSISDAFQLLAAKRLKLPVPGKQYAEVGDDVTEHYKDNKWLSSLIDMGEVILVPRGAQNVALNVTGTANPNNVAFQNAAGVTGGKDSSEPAEVAPEPVVEEPTPEPEPVVESVEEVAEEAEEITDPADHSAGDVIAYAEANPDTAGNLLEKELSGKARKSVVSALTDLAQAEDS